ncbi:MAG TPA: hypothetical protein VFQ50_00350 [Flavobacterium sp.]|jgi:hypothetical protein|nr:hypothetical protein [Flavobacterium sp.]
MLNIITSLSSSILGLLAQGVSDIDISKFPALHQKTETSTISAPPLFLIANNRRVTLKIAKS